MKTKNPSTSKIKSFAIDEDKKSFIINDGEIEIVFKDLFYFKIIKFILDKMKTSSIEAATGEEICGEFRSTPRGVKRKRPEIFRSFYNAWIGGFTKCHKNSQYFSVNYNKKLWEQDNKRRDFLSNFFIKDEHSLLENTHFWLNIPMELLTFQPYSKYLLSLKENFKFEFPTPTTVFSSDYGELEYLPLKATKIEKNQTKSSELPENIIEIIKNNKTLAIIGDAGCGKSFTLRKVVLDCANNKLPWIPIYVKLIDVLLSTQEDLESWIDFRFFKKLDSNLTIDKLKSENNKEFFIFLFDGLDEAGPKNEKDKMESAILKLMKEFNQSKCVVTSRPVGYENILPNFETFEIEPFDNQIPEFVSNFFKEDKEKRNAVLKYLEENRFKELASNPFQLFLICDTIKKDGKFPHNKGQVFKNFIESIKMWRERPKREKGIYKHFDLLEEIFKEAAFQIMDEDMKYIKEDALCNIVEEAKEKCKRTSINSDPQDIINEYVMRSGFLQRIYDKNKVEYNFIHLAWGDYFAACSFGKLKLEDLLKKIREELLSHSILRYSKWDNVITLLVGIMDNETSDKVVDSLTDVAPLLAARCLPAAKYVASKTEDKLFKILIETSKDNKHQAGIESIYALGNTKSKKVIEPLINFLKETQNTYVIRNVAKSLREILSEKVVDFLIQLLEESKNAYEKNKDCYTKTKYPYDENKDYRAFSNMVVALGEIITDDSLEILIKLLGESKDENVTYIVTEVLIEIETKRVLCALTKFMKGNKSSNVICNIANFLRGIVSEETLGLIGNSLENNKDNNEIITVYVDSLSEIISSYIRHHRGKSEANHIISNIVKILKDILTKCSDTIGRKITNTLDKIEDIIQRRNHEM